MERGAENPTYQLAQAMIRGYRCGMCGRSDLRATDYAIRDGRIIDVPRRLVPRLCALCECEWRSYRRGAVPTMLRELSSVFLADALAAMVRPTTFTLCDYAAVTPEQWHTLAAGYLIVQEIWRRAVDCRRRMDAARREPRSYQTARRTALP